MAVKPIRCRPETSVQDAAREMRENRVSSLCVTVPKKEFVGFVTTRDLSGKVLAEGLPFDTPPVPYLWLACGSQGRREQTGVAPVVGLTAGVGLLFDETVAKPIERLATSMRTHAHAGVEIAVDAARARDLGDPGPAARAVAGKLSQTTLDAAEAVASETARLSG